MGIIIQKFGGTSLRNLSKNSEFLRHVKKEVSLGNKLILVVSAMGRKGDPYATDTLMNQLENINEIIDPKKKDIIMSVGETISAAMVSHLLESEGMKSEPLTGLQAGIITDNKYNSSKIIEVKTEKIQKYLGEDLITVVAGFQGATKDLDITTLGRGGSDTTAVALGGNLNAERVDIFTDVPGVAITDPRVVSQARYIKEISYDDMYKLAINGAGVIHPRAVLLGKKYNIPIRIRSTFNDEPGTLVSWEAEDKKFIGFGINKKKENSIISFIFNSDYYDEVKDSFEKFMTDKKDYVIDLEHFSDRISIVVDNGYLKDFLQKLYFNFF